MFTIEYGEILTSDEIKLFFDIGDIEDKLLSMKKFIEDFVQSNLNQLVSLSTVSLKKNILDKDIEEKLLIEFIENNALPGPLVQITSKDNNITYQDIQYQAGKKFCFSYIKLVSLLLLSDYIHKNKLNDYNLQLMIQPYQYNVYIGPSNDISIDIIFQYFKERVDNKKKINKDLIILLKQYSEDLIAHFIGKFYGIRQAIAHLPKSFNISEENVLEILNQCYKNQLIAGPIHQVTKITGNMIEYDCGIKNISIKMHVAVSMLIYQLYYKRDSKNTIQMLNSIHLFLQGDCYD